MFTGLCDLEVGDEAELDVGNGFSLVKPNEYLLSARDRNSMTGAEFEDAASASRYLVYRQQSVFPASTYEEIKSTFLFGLTTLQMLKPVKTLGIVFYGLWIPSGGISLQFVERRPPMEPGPWALQKVFDHELLGEAPSAIKGVLGFVNGPSAERRNAFILLQLGLEHFHPLIAGLLWVMGLEAIFDSANRNDFKKKLCDCLGSSTKVFPAWSAKQTDYTVEDIAIDLYILRSKLAHGVDLRKSASDPKYPVDLLETHPLPHSFEEVPYALILSEAACYLLCQVLRKEIKLAAASAT